MFCVHICIFVRGISALLFALLYHLQLRLSASALIGKRNIVEFVMSVHLYAWQEANAKPGAKYQVRLIFRMRIYLFYVYLHVYGSDPSFGKHFICGNFCTIFKRWKLIIRVGKNKIRNEKLKRYWHGFSWKASWEREKIALAHLDTIWSTYVYQFTGIA